LIAKSKSAFSLWFICDLIVLFLPIYLIINKVIKYTHGVFIYPFDDTFIHLKIADNLLKGNWGINSTEFVSASSSILYTLILAVARIFSHSALVPLMVNCLSGILILIALHFWLKKHFLNSFAQLTIIAFAILLTPLALLVISGMEHTLQCLFSFLFMFYFSDWLSETKRLDRTRIPFKIILFAILTASIRYEGLFLIVTACLLLLVYKKFFDAFLLGMIAMAPVIVFGLISVSKRNYFLPNSVLVKSSSFNYSSPVTFLYDIVFDKLLYPGNGLATLATQKLILAIPLLFFLFRKHLADSYFFILIFLFCATLLQLSFASTGYLYRYEAYLFFCFTLITSVLFFEYGMYLYDSLKSSLLKIISFIIAFFLLFPVVLRSVSAFDKTPKACINIYDQQYQMAMFTKQYFNESNIALNDIGAMAYFTKANIIDLWGLANIEVTRSKKFHYWNPEFLDSLCKSNRVEFAIVYDTWFDDQLLKKWTKVATWQIRNNVICGDSKVCFYSLAASSKGLLYQRLRNFESKLPASVSRKYY
jgi:hypothetical protein